jgi:hypothetical protein
VHRLIEIAAGNIDVAVDLVERPVGHDETKPPRMCLHLADDEVHAVGETETRAAGLDELAGGGEVLEKPFERRALLARNLEPLHELPRGGWVLDLVANQLENLIVVQHLSESIEKGGLPPF